MGESKSDCVKVAIRCRPLSSKELGNDEASIVQMEDCLDGDGQSTVILTDPDGKETPAQFAFDIVFGMDGKQEAVYELVGKPALDSTMTGYNGTIFAYGQTGSGKSWCMMGASGELRGIIPRVNEQLFVRVDEQQQAQPTSRFLVMCSFFEIYNEIIFDLLNPCQDRSKLGAGLQVKEHPVLGIYVKDLQEIVVTDSDKLEKLMNSGTKNRAVSSTLMNSVSSRSHSIFTIKVHQKDEEDKSKNVFAKLNLVDLAGSERQKGTGASGQTLKEGANINKSLSALGNVINALVENANGKKVFVPFRNSKLTRVLQESLGGNSLCTMLATLSPAACNYEETMSTLRYANRAKAIKVSATKNEEASQISRLNAEIEELKKKLSAGGGGGGGAGLTAEERQEMEAKYETQLKEMQAMVDSTWEEKAQLSAQMEAQLSKALEEHKRQARAMQEECRKRFRLMQEQEDLELSIRGLLDTLQSLPSKAQAADADAAEGPCHLLRTGELPKQWLQSVAAIAEVADSVKQQQNEARIFHVAFSEDLKLWVDGEEATDHAMARTGARRALTKLETLKKECGKLADLETQGRTKAQEFSAAVVEAKREWFSLGKSAILGELREADAENGISGGQDSPPDSPPDGGLPRLYMQTLEDIGRIMQLIQQQAEARAEEFNALAALEIRSTANLALRGTALVQGAEVGGEDAELMRSLTCDGDSEMQAVKAEGDTTPQNKVVALPPREERPLHEWTADDVDSTVEGTEFALSKIVPIANLNKKKTPQELLARPPPKYVHDVALMIREETSYLSGMSDEWPGDKNREGKLDLLQSIADAVASSLGLGAIEFDPADVLKGKEVAQTLRLLQLLAVAAAKEVQAAAEGGAGKAKVHRDKMRTEGLTRASDMPSVLEALGRCLLAASEQQAARDRQQAEGGHASPTRELESNYKELQDRLEGDTAIRRRHEERLAELQQELERTRSVLDEQTKRLLAAQDSAENAGQRKIDMRKQVESKRSGILKWAQERDCNGNPEVARVKQELQKALSLLGGKSEEKSKLEEVVQRLQQQQLEIDTQIETLDMEVRRMKQNLAMGLDGPQVLNQTEEILILQAENQKWDVKITSMEEKTRKIAEADDQERQNENGLICERDKITIKHDAIQTELQVIKQDRDGLCEDVELLWHEKQKADDDLEDKMQSYAYLTERLNDKKDRLIELQDKYDEWEAILTNLKENYEKNQQVVAKKQAEAKAGIAAPAAVAAAPTPAQAAPAPAGDGGGDTDSSHYSEEEFEEPDED